MANTNQTPDDFDLDLDKIFSRSGASPASEGPGSPVEPPQVTSTGPAVPPSQRMGAAETAGAPPQPEESKRRIAKFERKHQEASKKFTRLVTRPSAVIASSSGVPHREVDEPRVDSFGKKKPKEQLPDLEPNKAHSMLADVFEAQTPVLLDPHKVNRMFRFGLLALLLGGIATLSWLYVRSRTDAESQPGELVEQLTPQKLEERLSLARKTMQDYFAAPTWEEKAQYVLEPDRVRPKMKEWYEDLKSTDPVVENIQVLRPQQIGGRHWFSFQISAAGTTHQIRLQETKEGYRIDWENFVGFGTMAWDHFCASRPSEPKQMRVIIKTATDFGGVYTQEKHEAYSVQHPVTKEPVLRGYALKTDRIAQELRRLSGAEAEPQVNVYLQFDPGAEPDQVRIVDLVNEWQPY